MAFGKSVLAPVRYDSVSSVRNNRSTNDGVSVSEVREGEGGGGGRGDSNTHDIIYLLIKILPVDLYIDLSMQLEVSPYVIMLQYILTRQLDQHHIYTI